MSKQSQRAWAWVIRSCSPSPSAKQVCVWHVCLHAVTLFMDRILQWESMPSWRSETNGPMRNRNSTISPGGQGIERDHQECSQLFGNIHGRPMVNPMRSNQNLRVIWKFVNFQDYVWENLYRIIMRTILQEKVTNQCNIKKFGDTRSKRMEHWFQNGIYLTRFRHGNWRKSDVSKKEVIDEARTKGVKVHFVS